MVGQGAIARACAEVSTGSVGDSKAKYGQKVEMDPAGPFGPRYIWKNSVSV
jgi:hypothetical protein